ncbi:hypothetical protein SAMN04490356_0752 [Streptomyces melanosporofaciens]|uniref:Uncharacterized protein n=1 Tax=Streptomyces melanosporofaciens TaxID=67327 RepID=A0A1H4KIJ9_STRMJ|nr:hypothetical protein SAMN04490356_0752 [Streptomyces melanosporofaciens]
MKPPTLSRLLTGSRAADTMKFKSHLRFEVPCAADERDAESAEQQSP